MQHTDGVGKALLAKMYAPVREKVRSLHKVGSEQHHEPDAPRAICKPPDGALGNCQEKERRGDTRRLDELVVVLWVWGSVMHLEVPNQLVPCAAHTKPRVQPPDSVNLRSCASKGVAEVQAHVRKIERNVENS